MSSFDVTTPAGKVRLLISDLDPADVTFTDPEIGAFVDLEGGDVRRAAACALETLATNEALVQNRIRTLDLQTDGPAVAAELRARAAALRAQADMVDADGNTMSSGEFAVAELVVDQFTGRDRIANEWLRR